MRLSLRVSESTALRRRNPSQDRPHLHCLPLPTARRGDTANIERPSNRTQRSRAAAADFTDDRRNVLGEAIRLGLSAGDGTFAYIAELRITKHNAASLSSLQSIARPLRD